MSRRVLSQIERRAIWQAGGCACAYCGEPLRFRNLEIDHIVPQSLQDDVTALAHVREQQGLPDDFDIDGYDNLVPACSPCNGKKSAQNLRPGRIGIELTNARRLKRQVEALVARFVKQSEAERVRFLIAEAIDALMLDEATFDPDPTVDAALQGDGLWIGAEPLEVTLSVSRDVARYFKRRPVLVNQTILDERKDGTLLLSSRVGHDNEILPQVRYWVPHLQIVSPLSLRERLVIGMRQYLAAAAPDAHHQPYKEAP